MGGSGTGTTKLITPKLTAGGSACYNCSIYLARRSWTSTLSICPSTKQTTWSLVFSGVGWCDEVIHWEMAFNLHWEVPDVLHLYLLRSIRVLNIEQHKSQLPSSSATWYSFVAFSISCEKKFCLVLRHLPIDFIRCFMLEGILQSYRVHQAVC